MVATGSTGGNTGSTGGTTGGNNTDGDDGDGDNNDSNTEDDVAEIINNSYTVTQLNIVYGNIEASSISGKNSSYYYDNNSLALYYDQDTSKLKILGKIEIAWEEMTKISNVTLNKLRYKYFDETISVTSIEDLYKDNGDNTYTFTYPFVLSGDDMIAYSKTSSNKLIFTLTKAGDFPSSTNTFTARAREIIPINLASDPYSINGTYNVNNCTGSVGGSSSSWATDGYNLNISDAYFKIYDNGTLEVNFDVNGYNYCFAGLTGACMTISDYNITYNFYKNYTDSSVWWGQSTISYNPVNSRSTLKITDPNTTTDEQLNVYVKLYATATTTQYAEFDCRFTKTSDVIN